LIIDCIDGYFIFRPRRLSDLSDFMRLTGFKLERLGDYFTFSDLIEIKNYSLFGKIIKDSGIAIKTFEGHPWEVFGENKIVYDFSRGIVVPIVAVTQKVTLKPAGNYFLSNGLIVPGSINGIRKIKTYRCFFDSKGPLSQWKYSEVDYV